MKSSTPSPTSAKSTSNNKKTSSEIFDDLRIEDTFLASPTDLYLALIEPQRIMGYTAQKAEVDGRNGGDFSIYDGKKQRERLLCLMQKHLF